MTAPTRIRRTPDELRTLATAGAADLEAATAEEVVRWAAATFGDRLAVTSSMADAVVVHLVSQARPGVDVLFLDTGYHFAETIGTRDAVAATYAVTLHTLLPLRTVAQQDADHGPDLFARDPDRCCALRKVEPLDRALGGYDAWVTGLRRDESPTRAATPVVAFDEKRAAVKINPIARWTQDDVDAYVVTHGVLTNPLLMDGYASVGCTPCTRRVQAGEDARAGRWAGTAKTECGIHT